MPAQSVSAPGKPQSLTMVRYPKLNIQSVFEPPLPNAGILLKVPGVALVSERDVFTTTGTATVVDGSPVTVSPDRPINGVWMAVYFDGTEWVIELWNGNTKNGRWSSFSDEATPGQVLFWNLNTAPSPVGDEWIPAAGNYFTVASDSTQCVIVPSSSPGFATTQMNYLGEELGNPVYSNGPATFNGTTWDLTAGFCHLRLIGNVWTLGDPDNGAAFYFPTGSGLPINRPNSGNNEEEGLLGNLRIVFIPTAPGASASGPGGNISPTAPGLSTAAAGGNLSPSAPGAIS